MHEAVPSGVFGLHLLFARVSQLSFSQPLRVQKLCRNKTGTRKGACMAVDGWAEQNVDRNPYHVGHVGVAVGVRSSSGSFATEGARRSADRARAGILPTDRPTRRTPQPPTI